MTRLMRCESPSIRSKMADRTEPGCRALFYRALADLKYLGMIKHSKKKTDHMAKLAWKGL